MIRLNLLKNFFNDMKIQKQKKIIENYIKDKNFNVNSYTTKQKKIIENYIKNKKV